MVTRQNISHTGTRFNARGLNKIAGAANEYEMELIYQKQEEIVSIILLRGSVPLNWQTKANLIENTFVIDENMENHDISTIYFKQLLSNYDSIVPVSLLKFNMESLNDESHLNRIYNRFCNYLNEQMDSKPINFYGF